MNPTKIELRIDFLQSRCDTNSDRQYSSLTNVMTHYIHKVTYSCGASIFSSKRSPNFSSKPNDATVLMLAMDS